MTNKRWFPVIVFGLYFPLFFTSWPFIKLGLVYFIGTLEEAFSFKSGNFSGFFLIIAPLFLAVAGALIYVFVALISKLMELAVKTIKQRVWRAESVALNISGKVLCIGAHVLSGLLTFWIYQEEMVQLPFLSDLYEMFRPFPRHIPVFGIAVLGICFIHSLQFNKYLMETNPAFQGTR